MASEDGAACAVGPVIWRIRLSIGSSTGYRCVKRRSCKGGIALLVRCARETLGGLDIEAVRIAVRTC